MRRKEIEERLAVRLPVYAVFTKADLLAGFTEFFDDLDREKRGQVWGATFALTNREAGPVAAFVAEFQALIERLNSRLFDRLQAERSPPRRSLIDILLSRGSENAVESRIRALIGMPARVWLKAGFFRMMPYAIEVR